MSIFDFLRQKPAQPTNGAPPIQSGVIERSGTLYLCDPVWGEKGVKIIFLTPDLYDRYLKSWESWMAVQDELRALPKSLRPRKSRSVRRVSIPDA